MRAEKPDKRPQPPCATPRRSFRELLVAEIPSLRAFGVSLSGSMHLADDLVQDTLLKAWSHSASFTEGTNIRAWLFTILRNTYYSFYRKRSREVQDTDGIYSNHVGIPADQDGVVDLADLRKALAKLPEEQREVLIMIGATGLSYEETAVVCGVAIGTVKSRVNRGRARLAELLGIHRTEDPESVGAVDRSSRPDRLAVRSP